MSKRHRNLIDAIIAPENFRAAYRLAAKGKRQSGGYLQFKEYDAAHLKRLRERIGDCDYHPGEPRVFWVYEPKPRPITALPFADRIVQHAANNVLQPIFSAAMLPQSYACRAGMGAHLGAVRTQAMIRRLASGGRPVYALKTDFSKYFYSIDRARLWQSIDAKVSCRQTQGLIERFTPRQGTGIPIGSLLSQLWANVYGTEVDRFLCQTLKVPGFFRYMDDIVVLHNSRAVLEGVKDFLEWFCQNELRLEFSHWSIQPVERGVNFLGYRIFPGHKLLRRDSVQRAKRKIARYAATGDRESLLKFLASWRGHAQWADSHNLLHHLSAIHKQEARNYASYRPNQG